jgi:hypothetical protein
MKLEEKIKEVGAEIQPKLTPKPGYPVRNAYAHLFGAIKEICGKTYSEADPEKVLAIVEAIRQNPNGTSEEIKKEAAKIYRSKDVQ